jgi:hypothetical protein
MYQHPSPVAKAPDLSLEHEQGIPTPPPEPESGSPLSQDDPGMVTVTDPAEYIANWKKTLNSMIDTFILEQGRPLKSLNELVEHGMLETLPEAPGGLKFDIEPRYSQVVVVGQ